MSRLTRDGTAEPVSRDQILRRERGQRNIRFPCSADHEQDWQPYPRLIHAAIAICDDHTYIIVLVNFRLYIICRKGDKNKNVADASGTEGRSPNG